MCGRSKVNRQCYVVVEDAIVMFDFSLEMWITEIFVGKIEMFISFAT